MQLGSIINTYYRSSTNLGFPEDIDRLTKEHQKQASYNNTTVVTLNIWAFGNSLILHLQTLKLTLTRWRLIQT